MYIHVLYMYIYVFFLADGLVTLAPIADVEEGQDLNVCVDLICTGSTLGCELLVDLSVADDPPKTGRLS